MNLTEKQKEELNAIAVLEETTTEAILQKLVEEYIKNWHDMQQNIDAVSEEVADSFSRELPPDLIYPLARQLLTIRQNLGEKIIVQYSRNAEDILHISSEDFDWDEFNFSAEVSITKNLIYELIKP